LDYKHNSSPHLNSERGQNVGRMKCKSNSIPRIKPIKPVKSLYQKGVIWS